MWDLYVSWKKIVTFKIEQNLFSNFLAFLSSDSEFFLLSLSITDAINLIYARNAPLFSPSSRNYNIYCFPFIFLNIQPTSFFLNWWATYMGIIFIVMFFQLLLFFFLANIEYMAKNGRPGVHSWESRYDHNFYVFFKQAVKIKILPIWLSFGSSLQWAKWLKDYYNDILCKLHFYIILMCL